MELIKEMLMSSLLTLVVALVVTLVFGPVFIPWLRKLKFGQEIREEGGTRKNRVHRQWAVLCS